jgi:TolA-binding protein
MTSIRRLLTGILVLSSVPARPAPPPSVRTPQEVLWSDLRGAAQSDYGGEKALELMRRFLKENPADPRSVNVRYMMAEREFARGDYKAAAVSLEGFLRDYPDHNLSDSAAYRLGESYYNLKVYNSAYTAWENLVQRHKDSALVPDALAWMAVVRMKARDWGRSDELMKQLQSQYPHHLTMVPHRENFGVILYHLGEYTDAVQILHGLDRDKGAYYRGLALFSLKLYEDAVAALQTLEFSKGGPYLESAAFLKAEGFFQKRNYSLASAEFKSFVTKFPVGTLAPHAHLRIAACALVTKDTVEARASADRALTFRSLPPDVAAYAAFVRGSALLEQKAYGPAAESFARSAPMATLPDLAGASLVRQAWCYKLLGDTASFEKTLQVAAEKYPSATSMPLVHFLQGAWFFEKKEWEKAGTHLEAGLIRYPYSVLTEAALGLMAVAYTRANRQDELVTSANAALKVLAGNYSTASPYWRAQSYYFIGKAYYDLKRYKDAVEYLEKVTTDFSDHPLAPAARLHLAWCLEETGRRDQALAAAAAVIADKKADPALVVTAEFLRGAAFFNAKQFDKAIGHLTDFVKAHPKNAQAPEAQYLAGLAYHQKRVYGSAVEEWAKLVNGYPESVLAKEAYLQIGDVYFKAGKYEESAAFFKKFHDRWPGDAKYGEIALWQEIQSYFNGKADETAIKVYPVYLEKYPQSDNAADAVKQLEMVYYRRGEAGDPAKLEEFLRRYPESPFAPAARYRLGSMSIEQEKWTLAAQHMTQFVRDYPKDALVPEALLAAGRAYEKLEDGDKAADQYKVLMTNHADKPAAIDAAFRLGMVYFTREKYKEALDAFQYAEKRKLSAEAKANLLYNMALCRENLGMPVEAAATYGEFARIAKDQERVREALLTAGYLLRKVEDYKGATGYLEKYLRDPGSPEGGLQAVNLLAECWLGLKMEPKAMETYERLVAMDPSGHDLRLTGLAQLAYHYEQAKDFSKALRIYEKMAISGGKAEWVQAAKQRVDALTEAMNQVP